MENEIRRRSRVRLSSVELSQFDKKPNAPPVWPAVLTSFLHCVSGRLRSQIPQATETIVLIKGTQSYDMGRQ